MVRSPDEDIDFFNIFVGVLQGDSFAPCLFILCRDCVLRTSVDLKKKENGFKLKTAISRRYPTKTVTEADHAENLAPAQEESQLHCLLQAARHKLLHEF